VFIGAHQRQKFGKFNLNRKLWVDALRARADGNLLCIDRLQIPVNVGGVDNSNIDFSITEALSKGSTQIFQTEFQNAGVDWKAIQDQIVNLVRTQEQGPPFLRLAFHDFGTFHLEHGKGGGGTVRFLLPDGKKSDDLCCLPQNTGLIGTIKSLESIQKDFNISWADLFVFAAVVAVKTLGGPTIPFKSGRVDFELKDAEDLMTFYKNKYSSAEHSWKLMVLPKPNHAELLVKFYKEKYGFGIREIVTYNGAHTIGGTTFPDGVRRTWTTTPQKFTNAYYTGLLNLPWGPKGTMQAHDDDKNETARRLIWRDGKDNKLILLETDFCQKLNLGRIDENVHVEMKKICEEYAADENLFFRNFAEVFCRGSELGWNNLQPVTIHEE